jgi:hypothetical protein
MNSLHLAGFCAIITCIEGRNQRHAVAHLPVGRGLI